MENPQNNFYTPNESTNQKIRQQSSGFSRTNSFDDQSPDYREGRGSVNQRNYLFEQLGKVIPQSSIGDSQNIILMTTNDLSRMDSQSPE